MAKVYGTHKREILVVLRNVAKTNKKGKGKSGQKRNMLRDTKVQKYDRVQRVCVRMN